MRIYRKIVHLISAIKNLGYLADVLITTKIGEYIKINSPSHIYESDIGDYTYIAFNSFISHTKIGKFCSIGPNFFCGWGIHPIDGISTSPMFYSELRQNGITLCNKSKTEETKQISIGNDVFIGANVIILDGVTIGDGAVIGAGAVVSKDIPAYAVAFGCPITIKHYRFDESVYKELQRIKWWDMNEFELKLVEQYFYDIEGFIRKMKN